MFSVMLGARLGISKGDHVPQERVVEAQTTGGECCKRYDLTLHVPAEERDPSAFVKRIQWKNTSGFNATVAPIKFSVEYCAGLNLEGPCSSYLGEITIDGQIQELGASNGGAASWPLPYCDFRVDNHYRGLCKQFDDNSGNPPHACKLVELFRDSFRQDQTHPICGYGNDDPASNEPCSNDFDHHLTIAEKIFLGQTKRFKRIWIIQDPAADPNTGLPPRLIQRDDPTTTDPETGSVTWQCGPDVDQFFMVVQPWLEIPSSQFEPVDDTEYSSNPLIACRFVAEACFPYWFYRFAQ